MYKDFINTFVFFQMSSYAYGTWGLNSIQHRNYVINTECGPQVSTTLQVLGSTEASQCKHCNPETETYSWPTSIVKITISIMSILGGPHWFYYNIDIENINFNITRIAEDICASAICFCIISRTNHSTIFGKWIVTFAHTLSNTSSTTWYTTWTPWTPLRPTTVNWFLRILKLVFSKHFLANGLSTPMI